MRFKACQWAYWQFNEATSTPTFQVTLPTQKKYISYIHTALQNWFVRPINHRLGNEKPTDEIESVLSNISSVTVWIEHVFSLKLNFLRTWTGDRIYLLGRKDFRVFCHLFLSSILLNGFQNNSIISWSMSWLRSSKSENEFENQPR